MKPNIKAAVGFSLAPDNFVRNGRLFHDGIVAWANDRVAAGAFKFFEDAKTFGETYARELLGEPMTKAMRDTLETRKKILVALDELEAQQADAFEVQAERDRLTAKRDEIAASLKGELAQLESLKGVNEEFVFGAYSMANKGFPSVHNAVIMGQTLAGAREAEKVLGRLVKKLEGELAEANAALAAFDKPAKAA